jgi:hypothetical protein
MEDNERRKDVVPTLRDKVTTMMMMMMMMMMIEAGTIYLPMSYARLCM